MENCIFCKIVRGDVPCEKVWENEKFMSFATIEPVGEGHTLVIPKTHFKTLMDLNEDLSKEYIDAIKKTGKVLMESLKADGFNSVVNNGEGAGQTVHHVHFHILPRKNGDKKRGLYVG